MANPVWPLTLPQVVNAGGYKETPAQGAITTPQEEGPPKSRKRFTAVPRNFEVSVTMTSDQVDTLMDFWEDTLGNGSLRFDWIDFRNPATVKTYSFTPGKEPTVVALDDDIFTVSFPLMRWP